MIYDELLAIVDDYDIGVFNGMVRKQAVEAVAQVFRAVVELHKPMADWRKSPLEYDVCACCGWEVKYPCPTIQAIEKELV